MKLLVAVLFIFVNALAFIQATIGQEPESWGYVIPNQAMAVIINFDYALSSKLACGNLTVNNWHNCELSAGFNTTLIDIKNFSQSNIIVKAYNEGHTVIEKVIV